MRFIDDRTVSLETDAEMRAVELFEQSLDEGHDIYVALGRVMEWFEHSGSLELLSDDFLVWLTK